MTKYRVMAVLSQMYEVEVEANSQEEAMELADGIDYWNVWDSTGMSDDFRIISAEEIE
jgi:hypothetical protein